VSFLAQPAISWSISVSVGMKGSFRGTLYVGGVHVRLCILRKHVYASAALSFRLLHHSCLAMAWAHNHSLPISLVDAVHTRFSHEKTKGQGVGLEVLRKPNPSMIEEENAYITSSTPLQRMLMIKCNKALFPQNYTRAL